MTDRERIKADLLRETYALDMAKRNELDKAAEAIGPSLKDVSQAKVVELLSTRLAASVSRIVVLRKRVPRTMIEQAKKVLAMV